MKYFIILSVSIMFEILAASMLKLSEGFSILLPSTGVIIGYGISFTLLILSLKKIPLSIAYSIWAGLGTAGTALVGMFVFNENLSTLNIFGLIIIIAGVVIMNLNKTPNPTENTNVA